jgi:hypothetical protein
VHDPEIPGALKLADIERGFENPPDIHVLCIASACVRSRFERLTMHSKDKSKSVQPSSSIYS